MGLAGGNRVSTTDGGPGIFKTIDAGVTWVRKFSQSANDVIWLNNTTAIAPVGTSIYRSTDAGETWFVISNQISTGLGDMSVLPNGTIVGVSDSGAAWRSTDGGLTGRKRWLVWALCPRAGAFPFSTIKSAPSSGRAVLFSRRPMAV